MFKKLSSLMLVGGLLTTGASAQSPCGTDDVLNRLKQENPAIAVMEAKFEQEIQEQLKFIDLKKYAKTTTEYYDIPVVIHIVHDYGSEYVTDDAIFNAVSNWAFVFMKQNADTIDVIDRFKPVVGHPKIRLRLATKDPNGNPTKGITRRRSYLSNNAGDQAKLDGWPNTSYINFWFINKFSGDHSSAAAYAYYPFSGGQMPYYDGIIGLSTYLDYQKAIPHEIGHVLNLQHTWGNTNAPNVACGDDQVADTPPTKGHLATGCTASNIYDVTCASPDTTNAQNIMDYTYCQKMFTHGQVDRMHAALASSTAGRNNLYSAANLAATGALAAKPDLQPTADFSMEKGSSNERTHFLCANDATKFSFRNRSWNDTITSVQWTFSNGAETPTSTSATTVFNQFAQPGWVTVSLTATGNNSGSTTYTSNDKVYVADNNTMQPGGYYQDFGSVNDMEKWPYFNYYDNQFKWEWYNGAGFWDNSSVRYRSYDDRVSPANKTGTPVGDYDDLISPAFDLTSYSGGSLNLNFYTSGASRAGISNDSLQMLVSYDCGKIWRRMTSIKGTQLINNGYQGTEFVPTSSNQWKAQTVSLPAAYLSNNKIFFKFRYWPSEYGNNLYFDRFSVTPFTTEVEEVASNVSSLKVYPNPSNGNFSLAFRTGNDGKVTYIIKDITGKLVYSKEEKYSPNTVITTELKDAISANGLYLLTVVNATNTMTEKLVISK